MVAGPGGFIANALNPRARAGVCGGKRKGACAWSCLTTSSAWPSAEGNARLAAANRLAHRHQEAEPGCLQMFDMAMDEPAPEEPMGFQALRRARAPGGAAPVRPAGAARYSPDTDPDEDDTL